jgi:predicted amidohydrolase YtcJ
MAGPETKRVDLGRRVVTPGINDAHFHCDVEPAHVQLRFKSMDPTWKEVAEELTAAEAKAPKGFLVMGEIGPTALDDPRATIASLDQLAPTHPVVLNTWTQHATILNSAGLRKLGVKEDEPDPLGGRFVRSPEDGKLTGVAYEYAKFRMDLRRTRMATDEEALQQTREFLKDAVRLGITSVHTMSMPGGTERCVALYVKAPAPIRVRVIRMPLTGPHRRDQRDGRDLPQKPSPLLTVSGTKWVLDGSPIEHSAALRKPYVDRPDTSGWLDFSEKEMEAMLRESLESGDQLLVHAVGDRTNETFLSAMEATGGKEVWSRPRVRIEHGDGIMPRISSLAPGSWEWSWWRIQPTLLSASCL